VPDLSLEHALAIQHGAAFVAGVDEAGRGALAGPVYAAAVVLPLDQPQIALSLREVDDSKRLSPAIREQLFGLICTYALAYGIGAASAEFIDQAGIVAATHQAMLAAVVRLAVMPDHLLIDGRVCLPSILTPQSSVVRGDSLSLSIAAASILAKVSRDRYMVELDGRYPEYGFARHKGYGTFYHLAALAAHGPCPEHRRSFAPLKISLLATG
jgi:ribonuclease HII